MCDYSHLFILNRRSHHRLASLQLYLQIPHLAFRDPCNDNDNDDDDVPKKYHQIPFFY